MGLIKKKSGNRQGCRPRELLKVLEGGYDNIDDLMGESYTSEDNSNLLFIQKGENDSFILRATFVGVDDDSTNK